MNDLLAAETKTILFFPSCGIGVQLPEITDYAVTVTFNKLGYGQGGTFDSLPYPLKKQIEEIVDERIRELSGGQGAEDIEEIGIEELTFEEAKSRVIGYLKANKVAYLSELQKELHIDLVLLADVVQKLIEEGSIKG